MSGPLIDYSLVGNVLSALPLADVLSNVVAFNGRVLLLLSVCLLLLRFSKGSAANRHLFLFLSLCAALSLPFSSTLIPPIEFEVESTVAWLPTITSAVNQEFIDVVPTSWSSPDLAMLLCFVIYTGGVLLLLSKIVWENALVWLVIKLSKPVAETIWLAALHRQQRKLSIALPVSIRYSRAIVSPLTWGVFHPVILLPADALQWSTNLINSTLLHELAHIRRRDWFLQQVARCICACYWLNPLCWLIFRKLCRDAETACDDVVINTGIKQSYYADDLLNVAKQVHSQSYRLATIGMAEPSGTTELKRRVHAILNPNRLRGPNSLLQMIVTFVIVGGFLVPLSSLRASYVQVTTILAPTTASTAAEDRQQTSGFDIAPFDKTMVVAQFPQLRRVSTPIDMSNIKTIAEREIRKTFAFASAAIKDPSPAALVRTPEVRPVASVDSSPADRKTGGNTTAAVNTALNSVAAKTQLKNSSSDINEGTPGFPRVIPQLATIEYSHTFDTDNNDAVESITYQPTSSLADRVDETQSIALNQNDVEAYSRKKVVKPAYPRRARARGIEGEVVVEFEIDRRGNVIDPQVIEATPSGIFDSSVLRAIKKFSFNPHKINGKAVSVEGVRETFVFVIET